MPYHKNIQIHLREKPGKPYYPFTHIDFDDEPPIKSPQVYEGISVTVDDIDDELGILCTRTYVPDIQDT